jgi:hypothetical protein
MLMEPRPEQSRPTMVACWHRGPSWHSPLCRHDAARRSVHAREHGSKHASRPSASPRGRALRAPQRGGPRVTNRRCALPMRPLAGARGRAPGHAPLCHCSLQGSAACERVMLGGCAAFGLGHSTVTTGDLSDAGRHDRLHAGSPAHSRSRPPHLAA